MTDRTDRESRLLRDNERLRAENRAFKTGRIWIGIPEAAKIAAISEITLRKWCASGQVDPRCGVKMGNCWRFRRAVVMVSGILLR
jgi:hypothetical protein